jgi:hypothetical protein
MPFKKWAVQMLFQRCIVQQPVALSDGATIAVDAALGNHFRVTLGASGHTLGNPSNLTDGQKLLFEVVQDATGSRTLAYGTKYKFSTDVPQPTLTTTAGATDYLGFVYRAADDELHLLGVNRGFA